MADASLVAAERLVMQTRHRKRCACGNLIESKGVHCGRLRFGQTCTSCRKNKTYRSYAKKPYCERCGFVAAHPAQLDVDHIDGDHKNNKVANLTTLCANCHRLKTIECGDHLEARQTKASNRGQRKLFE